MRNRTLIWAGKNHAIFFESTMLSDGSGASAGVRVQYVDEKPYRWFSAVGHSPLNSQQIARATRARELGLDIQIPAPEFPAVDTTAEEFQADVKFAWESRRYDPTAKYGEWVFESNPPRSHVGNGAYLESALPANSGEAPYDGRIRSEVEKIAPGWVIEICDRLQAVAKETDRANKARRENRERKELAREFGLTGKEEK